MEIRSFIHEAIVKRGRKYFVTPTLNDVGELGSTYLANPEEYVRQDVIRTLHEDYGYPYIFMVVENMLVDKRRIDLVVVMPSSEVDQSQSDGEPLPFSGDFIPYIIVECKKSTEPLNDDHVKQGLDYARSVRPDYLIVTNGISNVLLEPWRQGGSLCGRTIESRKISFDCLLPWRLRARKEMVFHM